MGERLVMSTEPLDPAQRRRPSVDSIVMRITDGEGRPHSAVYLALTDREAGELIDTLERLKSAASGWHEHVNDESYTHEITVYREDDPTASM